MRIWWHLNSYLVNVRGINQAFSLTLASQNSCMCFFFLLSLLIILLFPSSSHAPLSHILVCRESVFSWKACDYGCPIHLCSQSNQVYMIAPQVCLFPKQLSIDWKITMTHESEWQNMHRAIYDRDVAFSDGLLNSLWSVLWSLQQSSCFFCWLSRVLTFCQLAQSNITTVPLL